MMNLHIYFHHVIKIRKAIQREGLIVYVPGKTPRCILEKKVADGFTWSFLLDDISFLCSLKAEDKGVSLDFPASFKAVCRPIADPFC